MTRNKFVRTCVGLYGERGWQAALATNIDVDPSSVRRWTSGAVPVPGPVAAYLEAMAAYYKVMITVDRLIAEHGTLNDLRASLLKDIDELP